MKQWPIGTKYQIYFCYSIYILLLKEIVSMILINNNWIKVGALVAALAVVVSGVDWMQSFGLSKNQNLMNEAEFRQYILLTASISTAVTFQFVHALAIILVGTLAVIRPGRLWSFTGSCFLIGIIVYSGSIYWSVFCDYLWLESLKFVGVCILILAWILLLEAACPGWNTRFKNTEQKKS